MGAFLGPKIWQTPITLNQLTEEDNDEEGVENNVDVAGAEFSVMNIDDFLQENNFDFGNVSPTTRDIYAVESRGQRSMIKDEYRRREVSPPESTPSEYSDYSMMDTDQTFTTESVGSPPSSKKPKIELPKGDNTFLYVESKRARLEREREERRRREEARIEFSAEELALATVPGADFDPTARQFSMEELRPQPIIRKRRKSYVQPEKKDDKYWETRSKAIERKPNFTENGLSGTTKQSFISYGHRSKRKTRQTFVGDKKVNRKIEEVSNCFTLFKYG